MLTSAKLKGTSVTSTPFVSTLKDHISAAVVKDIRETVSPAQVQNKLYLCILFRSISVYILSRLH